MKGVKPNSTQSASITDMGSQVAAEIGADRPIKTCNTKRNRPDVVNSHSKKPKHDEGTSAFGGDASDASHKRKRSAGIKVPKKSFQTQARSEGFSKVQAQEAPKKAKFVQTFAMAPAPIDFPPRSAAVPYKAVLILSRGLALPDDIKVQFKQEGYIFIGADLKYEDEGALATQDYSMLQGKIDETTRIFIVSHGYVDNNEHILDGDKVDGIYTRELLKKISIYSNIKPNGQPNALSISLISCYGGAAADCVFDLPVGSVLMALAPKDVATFAMVNEGVLLESSKDLRYTYAVEDFTKRFALYARQMATISIKKPDGTVFSHTIRPPQIIPTIPGEAKRYLEWERAEFIKAYNLECSPEIMISTVPEITEQEAIEWCHCYCYFMMKLAYKKMDYTEFNRNTLELLLSLGAELAYHTGKVKVNDLVRLDIDKIELLISREAVAAYQTGSVRVNDLVRLDRDKIELLISRKAVAIYRKGVDAKKLSQLPYDEMCRVYAMASQIPADIAINKNNLTLMNKNLTHEMLRQLNQCLPYLDTHELSETFLQGQTLLARKHIAACIHGEEQYLTNPDKYARAMAMLTFCSRLLEEREPKTVGSYSARL